MRSVSLTVLMAAPWLSVRFELVYALADALGVRGREGPVELAPVRDLDALDGVACDIALEHAAREIDQKNGGLHRLHLASFRIARSR